MILVAGLAAAWLVTKIVFVVQFLRSKEKVWEKV